MSSADCCQCLCQLMAVRDPLDPARKVNQDYADFTKTASLAINILGGSRPWRAKHDLIAGRRKLWKSQIELQMATFRWNTVRMFGRKQGSSH